MEIYLYIVAAVLIFGLLMPQRGLERKYYIALMTAIHIFVCAFRYNHLHGDLMKYHYEFNTMASYGWLSEEVLHEGRNVGFYLLMKLVNELTGADFQMLLILIAAVTHIILAYVIYEYSPAPWMSFLIWNCMAFYVFGFYAIKQILAMLLVMLSYKGIAEKNLKFYLTMLALAAFLHMPALVFLPAYWICQNRIKGSTLIVYVLFGVLLYFFREDFVALISTFYYEEEEFTTFSKALGNRFIMLLLFSLFSVLLSGVKNADMERTFHLMAIATILQMLSSFDHVFTRLTDYYFQISVIYLPTVFFSNNEKKLNSRLKPIFPFNKRSLNLMGIIIAIYAIWFYWNYSGIFGAGDTYRFMWE